MPTCEQPDLPPRVLPACLPCLACLPAGVGWRRHLAGHLAQQLDDDDDEMLKLRSAMSHLMVRPPWQTSPTKKNREERREEKRSAMNLRGKRPRESDRQWLTVFSCEREPYQPYQRQQYAAVFIRISISGWLTVSCKRETRGSQRQHIRLAPEAAAHTL